LQSVESSYPVLKIVIVEVDAPVIMLDPFGEDSRGVAVASWGAIIPRICVGETSEDPQTAARILSALRVLLGVDSDLPASWKRAPVPLADWEIERMRLRAILDNAMRAISAIGALKALTEKITNVVINDDVAARANEAVHLVQAGLENPGAPQLNKISAGRFLADEALSHPSLLSLLYFPKDQTMAVYLPIMLPTLIPLFGSGLALCKWALGWS
uniref:FeoB-type G domain-containing protein n=1 Tax=Angiostrongylus cantonensis TaxID=6313 RepID=A0A0K0CXZ3_ANGCA